MFLTVRPVAQLCFCSVFHVLSSLQRCLCWCCILSVFTWVSLSLILSHTHNKCFSDQQKKKKKKHHCLTSWGIEFLFSHVFFMMLMLNFLLSSFLYCFLFYSHGLDGCYFFCLTHLIFHVRFLTIGKAEKFEIHSFDIFLLWVPGKHLTQLPVGIITWFF